MVYRNPRTTHRIFPVRVTEKDSDSALAVFLQMCFSINGVPNLQSMKNFGPIK